MSTINWELVVAALTEAGEAVRARVRDSLLQQSVEERSAVFKESSDDTIYQIDRDVEEILVPILASKAEALGGIVLIAEGISEHGEVVLPEGRKESEAALRVIIDPIDGTRGIMYDKRSAFYLAAAAPNLGPNTRLQDLQCAVMVELPTSRAALADVFTAIKGKGVQGHTLHLEKGTKTPKQSRPSKADNVLGGFSQLVRFFPPGRDIMAAIDDALITELAGGTLPHGKAVMFEDQYISTGGQIYEMLVGHDRFTADLRGLLNKYLERKGEVAPGLICHPYDCCTALIGTEAGLIITDGLGNPLDGPLDTISPIDFILYANASLYDRVWPILQRLLLDKGLLV